MEDDFLLESWSAFGDTRLRKEMMCKVRNAGRLVEIL